MTPWAELRAILPPKAYDANNRVVGVTKPDGSVTTTVYDNKQRVISTVERTAGGVVITGFEYTYDDLSRIVEEKNLDSNTKMCYTYDSLNRVTARTVKNATTNAVISTETFNYDAAGNVTDAPDSCFAYDTNNRLVVFNGNSVSYDMDGNMLNNGVKSFTYDSANRLITADGHTYTYNAEGVRIRNLFAEEDTTYTYDTNCKLSKPLTKTTGGVVTKYVYGRGLIGEEVNNTFKTYHFDFRGSTIAITDESGNITDTFAYDTYGKLISRTGTSKVIFGYNGRDGVVTDDNGLIYMRARYYSPEMKRFVNADILAGGISNAITLNRFAYADGDPVSKIDPFGLRSKYSARNIIPKIYESIFKEFSDDIKAAFAIGKAVANYIVDAAEEQVQEVVEYSSQKIEEAVDQVEAVVDQGIEMIDRGVERAKATIEKGKEFVNNARTHMVEARRRGNDKIMDVLTSIRDGIVDNVGGTIKSEKEVPLFPPQYLIFYTKECGVGYEKSFETGKPVNFFASQGDNWWELWKYTVGLDVNINGYGASLEIGPESSLGLHLGSHSYDMGLETGGRLYFQHSYVKGDGYLYEKTTFNIPEIALAGLALYYTKGAVAPLVKKLIENVGSGIPLTGR